MNCQTCSHWDNGFCFRYPRPVKTTHKCGEYYAIRTESHAGQPNSPKPVQEQAGNKSPVEAPKWKPKRKWGR